MIIARLSVRYSRGVECNSPEDIGLKDAPATVESGGLIRGLGTHFKDEAERLLVQERDREWYRIRRAFRSRFMTTPIDGVYIVPRRGMAGEFVKSLDIRDDVAASVQEFYFAAAGEMSNEAIAEWAQRVKSQLAQVALGRGKEADEEGLSALETLTSCPAMGEETRRRVRELVSLVRAQKIDRLELKRSIADLDVKLEPGALAPRRVGPVKEEEPAPAGAA